MTNNKSNQQKPHKKSQKQAADKKRPASKQNDKKYTNTKTPKDDSTVKLAIKAPTNGLTYRQYRELSNKDPNLLSASEKKKVEDYYGPV